MNHIKPPGSPPCWSKKYQDGDEECTQCRFRESCRSAMLYNISSQPLPPVRSYAAPVISPPSPLALPPSTQPVVAKPTWAAPTAYPAQVPYIAPPPKPTPITPPQPATYFQQSTGASVPNPAAAPNPVAHWQRPGATTQPYYFTQYPGESVGIRLAKNAVLRALEAIFFELVQFFRHWTWPPSKK